MKFCVDCKWFKRSFLMPAKLGKCGNPVVNVDYQDFRVDGKANRFAVNARLRDEQPCGKSGKLWESGK